MREAALQAVPAAGRGTALPPLGPGGGNRPGVRTSRVGQRYGRVGWARRPTEGPAAWGRALGLERRRGEGVSPRAPRGGGVREGSDKALQNGSEEGLAESWSFPKAQVVPVADQPGFQNALLFPSQLALVHCASPE